MYQIKCDGYVLYDPRDDDLIVNNPKCKLEVNTVGEASFSIYATHKYYGYLQKMKSIFEILQDGNTIFRGRMTDDTRDFNNIKAVDLEGVMAFFNDSIIRPFTFPDDFLDDADYVASKNKVEFFLKWIVDQHNSQVQPFQRFKLGTVTVADPNNYISRSIEDYTKTWEVLKTRLFDSALGGYLCIRYEEDGNYIDYLEDFLQNNTQKIVFGENLLDLTSESDASETYSAIIPLGMKKNEIDTESTDSSRLTIEELADGEITSDIVKKGDTLYSKSAVEKYGFIYAPTSESTWEDVSEAANLQTKGIDLLTNKGMKLANTITIKAVDLHFSAEEIEAFRIYRYIDVESKPHDHEGQYKLTKLEIDIQNPQNTVITLGDTQLSMTDINAGIKQNAQQKAENVKTILEIQLDKSLTEYEKVILEECEELYTSKIQQFAKTITLSINGSLGSEASIVLSAGAEKSTQKMDLTKVREAFAKDNTEITISAGLVTFNAGTLVINSENFKVSAEGVIEATSGTIGGWTLNHYKIFAGDGVNSKTVVIEAPGNATTYVFAAGGRSHDDYGDCPFRVTKAGKLYATDAVITGSVVTIDSPYKTELDYGSLRLYYNDVLCGTINTKYWSGASGKGVSLRIEEGGNYIMFSHPSDAGTGYDVDYYLNYGWSSNYDEMHIFQTSARFLDKVYFSGSGAYFKGLYLYDQNFVRSCATDGTVGEEMLGYSDNMVNVGSVGCPTLLRGTAVYLKNTSTTVTSDRNAKNSIEALSDAYEAFVDGLEPVRYKYNEGNSGRYHVGYIAQDVEAALIEAGLSTTDFAGYVNMGEDLGLGLSYDNFIALLHMKIKRLEQRLAVLEN